MFRQVRLFSNRAALFNNALKYDPKVLSQTYKGEVFPLNVEAIYHEPLKHKIKYNDLVAEIHFRSYGIDNMDFFINFAMRAAYYLGIPLKGVASLPTKKEKWTVIRAPFTFSKLKENFERSTHKRLLKAYDSTPEVIDLWISLLNKYSLPGIGIKTNVFVSEGFDALKALENVTMDVDKNIPYLKNAGENTDLVAERVTELLKDPVFKEYLNPEKKVEK